MRNKISVGLISLISLISLIGIFQKQVSAAPLTLTVFPAVQDINVRPGQNTRFQIQFKNGSDSIVTGEVKVADYVVVDKRGTTELVEKGQLAPKYGAASWVTIPSSVTSIPANDYVSLDLTANVPKDITSCGHYIVVYFQSQGSSPIVAQTTNQHESATGITSKIGGLVNFMTSGITCKEGASITDVSAPSFQEHGPITVNFDILNSSDVHITPQGVVIASNMFGHTVAQQPIKDQRIFPETLKSYVSQIGEKWMIGKYTFTIMATYGSQNKRVEQTLSVIVFPWKEALIAVLAIIIVALFISKSVKRMNEKEGQLEHEVDEEKVEIEKLKSQLKNRE